MRSEAMKAGSDRHPERGGRASFETNRRPDWDCESFGGRQLRASVLSHSVPWFERECHFRPVRTSLVMDSPQGDRPSPDRLYCANILSLVWHLYAGHTQQWHVLTGSTNTVRYGLPPSSKSISCVDHLSRAAGCLTSLPCNRPQAVVKQANGVQEHS